MEFWWRGGDVRQRLNPGVTPVLVGLQIEGAADEFIGFGIINFELFAGADRAVVPVVDAITIEIGLADSPQNSPGLEAA